LTKLKNNTNVVIKNKVRELRGGVGSPQGPLT